MNLTFGGSCGGGDERKKDIRWRRSLRVKNDVHSSFQQRGAKGIITRPCRGHPLIGGNQERPKQFYRGKKRMKTASKTMFGRCRRCNLPHVDVLRVVRYTRSSKWTEPRFLYAYCRSVYLCRACFVSLGYRGDVLFTIRNWTVELGFLSPCKIYNVLDWSENWRMDGMASSPGTHEAWAWTQKIKLGGSELSYNSSGLDL
jgi:hypothetical protein